MVSNLAGKRALVLGIANDRSIAWGIAKALHGAGCAIAMSFLNSKAEPFVRPLAEEVGAEIFMPLDVAHEHEVDELFDVVTQKWGRLDIFVHSLAFAPRDDLHGRVLDTSAAGFATAVDISVHSFIRLARRCEPLMHDGGTCMTMSFYGAEKVVSSYNMMGPVKAALEATVRELASELGPKNITVNAISPGPMLTRAAGGIDHFDDMMKDAVARSPMRRLATIEDVGALATFIAGPGGRNITGSTLHVDAGYHIMG